MDINRLQKIGDTKEIEINRLNADLRVKEGILEDRDEELEMKSGENNRLRSQVADLERTTQDLYRSRKGPGSDKIELDSLKADNDKLL